MRLTPAQFTACSFYNSQGDFAGIHAELTDVAMYNCLCHSNNGNSGGCLSLAGATGEIRGIIVMSSFF